MDQTGAHRDARRLPRRARCTLLVATDVAARGLDITGSQPRLQLRRAASHAEDYVHRIGSQRAARARPGSAVSLVTSADAKARC
ncbi:MAG: hypothetical protein MZV49_26020 [Rhodopseudomonas palustris]|nr:hypothetical protein [Rhodopseudomonas palustris]